ncbi:MAG TPA: SUMF1/EgtB/PvdO family nonheme iron enzyme, partial [Cyclobacteriaceae bacterium]
ITGKVFDSVSKEPLAFATIGVKGMPEQATSNQYGDFNFRVPTSYINDSLLVTYIGYKSFTKKISALESSERIYLQEAYTLLKELVVSHKQLNLRAVDNNFSNIRDNLYAMETEIKNEDYNLFLTYLEDFNQTELFKQCDYDLSQYSNSEKEYFKRYSGVLQPKTKRKDTVNINYSSYPAVNVSHEAAIKYCEWLTNQYNTNPNKNKKKFKKVKFRLPTLKEWQIAALGYPKFQSWNLMENQVQVVINRQDSVIELARGTKKMVPVDKDILYPWYMAYNYRNKAFNSHHCFLGNFNITSSAVYKSCKAYFHSYDGFSRMAFCAAYFPNGMGLYDVVGNVAEMIDEKGKACGGSWSDLPSESTIHSIKNYHHSDASIGFRVFMEVIEK